MKIASDVLQRFIDLPAEPRALRTLLDHMGIEVKRSSVDNGVSSLTLELLANRGDHHCYEGVARELSGSLGTPVRLPERAELAVGDSPCAIHLETDLCLVYTATELRRTGDDTLGPEAMRPLDAADIHSVSAPVDASNIANLELGQPTHAFDADTIDGPVTIRRSIEGERAWPLFYEGDIELPAGTLVIADDSKILAIAGVIGCEESKTTASTRRLLLESATFDPVAVRKASRGLNIHTDSSARFERGSDPIRPLVGAGRVVHLLESTGGWERVGTTGVVGAWTDPERVVTIDVDALGAFLQVNLSRPEVVDYLSRFGFTPTPDDADPRVVHVRVPPHRLWDVEFPADLYEEVAKAVGYNNTPVTLPDVPMGSLPSPYEVRKALVEEVLTGQGFYEVVTEGFYSRAVRAQLGIDDSHALWRHVETQNALDRAYSLLKNNALAQAVDTVATNVRMRNVEVKAYEWTRTFHAIDPPPSQTGDRSQPPCTERTLLWAIVSGPDRVPAWHDTSRPADVWFLKGILGELAVALGIDLAVVPAVPDAPLADLLHPNRQAAVAVDGEVVGILGEVHPSVCAAWKLKSARPVYAEIDADALLSDGERPAFSEPPSYHAIVRSLAFTLPDRVEAGDVATFVHASGPDWLASVDMTDLYAHEEDGQPMRTVTFELSYTNPDAARTADEVNAATSALIAAVEDQFGPRGVKLR